MSPFASLFLVTVFSISLTTHAAASSITVSRDGHCGGKGGQTCQGSTFGNCCSQVSRHTPLQLIHTNNSVWILWFFKAVLRDRMSKTLWQLRHQYHTELWYPASIPKCPMWSIFQWTNLQRQPIWILLLSVLVLWIDTELLRSRYLPEGIW